MKKFILFLLFLLIITTLSLVVWLYIQTGPTPPAPTKKFIISKSEPVSQIISRLESEHLIKSALAMRIYLKLNVHNQTFKPGTYNISAGLEYDSLIKSLSIGDKDLLVTFPEGWRKEQFAIRLASIFPNFNSQKFLLLTKNLEGQLFPDTYLFAPDVTEEKIIEVLHTNFLKKSALILPVDQDALIIASLVEREAKSDIDRPQIAAIIKKRLEQGWLLNIDASLQYAKDSASSTQKYWSPLVGTDFESPYNSYKFTGLPPTPICNPGLSSIKATQANLKTDYMFYIHDSEGQAHFAKTLSEHNLNVDKYLRN